jgi:broad specificity phosphatase PhoE
LSTIYLVRHGQAGTRDAYDSLSELGERQAQLLGEHFISQGIRIAAAFTGALTRQQETCAQIKRAYEAAGVPVPAICVDAGWNEFDLGRVYQEIAPQLCAQDADFRREYEEMQEQVRISNGAHGARIHRKWLPCDTKIVDAWIRNRCPYSGETWDQFRARVAACHARMPDRENVLVVTSATPIAIWAGLSLEIVDERVMRLAGAIHNTAYTIMRLRDSQLRLFTFNATPHLAAPGLRTHR